VVDGVMVVMAVMMMMAGSREGGRREQHHQAEGKSLLHGLIMAYGRSTPDGNLNKNQESNI
jgi:hypothetical protein